MPLAEPFDRLIDSPIADMKNVGPREGGSITAAQFIQRFIENGVTLGAHRHGRKGLVRQSERDLRERRDWLRRAAARPICRGRARSADARTVVQVDFYQLAGTPAEQVIASLAEKSSPPTGRLLVVAGTSVSREARPHALGPGRDELPSARRLPADPTMRASRSCCRQAPTRQILRAIC